MWKTLAVLHWARKLKRPEDMISVGGVRSPSGTCNEEKPVSRDRPDRSGNTGKGQEPGLQHTVGKGNAYLMPLSSNCSSPI